MQFNTFRGPLSSPVRAGKFSDNNRITATCAVPVVTLSGRVGTESVACFVRRLCVGGHFNRCAHRTMSSLAVNLSVSDDKRTIEVTHDGGRSKTVVSSDGQPGSRQNPGVFRMLTFARPISEIAPRNRRLVFVGSRPTRGVLAQSIRRMQNRLHLSCETTTLSKLFKRVKERNTSNCSLSSDSTLVVERALYNCISRETIFNNFILLKCNNRYLHVLF